jgi:hypothetical protein
MFPFKNKNSLFEDTLPEGQNCKQHAMIGQLVLLHHNTQFLSRNKSAEGGTIIHKDISVQKIHTGHVGHN